MPADLRLRPRWRGHLPRTPSIWPRPLRWGFFFSTNCPPSVRRRYGLVDFPPQHAVAFAGALLDRRAIENLDLAARVPDQPGFLQRVGSERDRGPLAAEHVREKFLRQVDPVAFHRVGRLQQPPAQPCLDAVKCMAGGGLMRLEDDDRLKPVDLAAKSVAPVQHLEKRRS